MRSYSCIEFAKHLGKLDVVIKVGITVALEAIAVDVEKKAKKKFGHYQDEIGPFVEWDELKESTKQDKLRQGYVYNDEYNPLVRTGELRDSIKHETGYMETTIGSDNPLMEFHEFGTVKMAARPVLGPALFEHKPFVIKAIAKAVQEGFYGRRNPNIQPSEGDDE